MKVLFQVNFSIIPSKLASQILVVIHTSKETEDEIPSLQDCIESACLFAKITYFSKLFLFYPRKAKLFIMCLKLYCLT